MEVHNNNDHSSMEQSLHSAATANVCGQGKRICVETTAIIGLVKVFS